MQPSATLKSACLTVGLVTAWSPLGDGQAAADAIPYTVSIWNNTSPATQLQNSFIGFALSGDTAVYSIPTLNADDTYIFNATFDTADPLDWVLVGQSGSNVVVSFLDSSGALGQSFFDVFGWSDSTVATALQTSNLPVIKSFISDILTQLYVSQVPDDSGELVLFVGQGSASVGEGVGLASVSLEPQLVVVPLPAGVMMGGSLLAFVGLSSGALAWIRRRTVGGLA